MFILRAVDVPVFYLVGARARGSDCTRWWIGRVGRHFVRVIRSFDRIATNDHRWHISASVGGHFGEASIRPPSDDEMHRVISAAGHSSKWQEDNTTREDLNVRHFWEVKG